MQGIAIPDQTLLEMVQAIYASTRDQELTASVRSSRQDLKACWSPGLVQRAACVCLWSLLQTLTVMFF